MWIRIKSFFKTDNFRYFLRYFGVFSLIFILLTSIILQQITANLYQSADKLLEAHIAEPKDIAFLAQARSRANEDGKIIAVTGVEYDDSVESDGGGSSSDSGEQGGPPPRYKTQGITIDTNSRAIFYGDDKGPLIGADTYLGLDQIQPDFNSLGTIQEVEVQTEFNTIDTYHYTVVALDGFIYKGEAISYAMSLVNVTQYKKTGRASQRIVLYVMIGAWLVSIFAALFLTITTVKPLKEAYEKQKNFVENASHELRTPLTVLQNRLESLFHKPDATILDESETISNSLEEVRNMRILTANLLNLARRDGSLKVLTNDVQPKFFDSLYENYHLIAEDNGKTLITKNLVKRDFQTDKALLKQLMTIIFDNAIKYTGEDGRIRITSKLRDRYLVVTVEDNGIGIPDEDKKKIFDRFYRVDKARTRQNGGFGLGLSLAKQLSESLRGTITVTDAAPKGSIFEIKLPLS